MQLDTPACLSLSVCLHEAVMLVTLSSATDSRLVTVCRSDAGDLAAAAAARPGR